MSGFSLFGVRLMREGTWTRTVLDHVTVRHERDALRQELAKVIGQGAALGNQVSQVVGQHREATDEVRAAIAKILECNRQLAAGNVRLAHRAEIAEAEVEVLQRQLVDLLRQP